MNKVNQDNKGKETTVYKQAIGPYVSGAGSNNSIKPQNVTYTITNDTLDRTFDADTATLTDVSDVLATLIRDLAAAGIIRVA